MFNHMPCIIWCYVHVSDVKQFFSFPFCISLTLTYTYNINEVDTENVDDKLNKK